MISFAQAIVRAWLAGIVDSIRFHNVLVFMVSSSVIRQNTFMCVALNLVIFIGSYYMLGYLILPLLRIILTFDPLPSEVADEGENAPEGLDSAILIEKSFFWLYMILWLYPIYAISNILSMIWYQSIVDAAYLLVRAPKASRRPGQMDYLSEKIYNIYLTIGLLLQMNLTYYIPFIGSGMYFFHICWIYSLYSFEYKWEKEGRRLASRLKFFEERWSYFLGFGFPLAALTVWFPGLVAYGLYAFTAPAFIMLAITAVPMEHSIKDEGSQHQASAGISLPIYTLPRIFADYASWCCCGGSTSSKPR
ncbi:hypothetical protein AAMO2058_001278200 [Amorphochlora amoebiformis]